MTPGILDSIDGALRDFDTSHDAMRWVPVEGRGAAPPGPPAAVAVSLHVDTDLFACTVREAVAGLRRFFDDIGTALLDLLPVMAAQTETVSEVSSCRAAPVTAEGRTTQFYVCAGCGQACDAVEAEAGAAPNVTPSA